MARHCVRKKRVPGVGLRCAKFSGKARKTKKKRSLRGLKGLTGVSSVDAYNKKCDCLKKNGRLKPGFRFKKGGRCVEAKG